MKISLEKIIKIGEHIKGWGRINIDNYDYYGLGYIGKLGDVELLVGGSSHSGHVLGGGIGTSNKIFVQCRIKGDEVFRKRVYFFVPNSNRQCGVRTREDLTPEEEECIRLYQNAKGEYESSVPQTIDDTTEN